MPSGCCCWPSRTEALLSHRQDPPLQIEEPPRHSPFDLTLPTSLAEQLRCLSFVENVDDLCAALGSLHALEPTEDPHALRASIDEFGQDRFFGGVLPFMVKLAGDLPVAIPCPPPHLTKNLSATVELTQKQCASLLACAFFCLLPQQTRELDLPKQGRFNFGYWFLDGGQVAKLLCVFHYFDRLRGRGDSPGSAIRFQRFALQHPPSLHDWCTSSQPLCPLHVHPEGTIEDGGRGCLQVDFANRSVGGGVLGGGRAQEEIRFSINPECMVVMLLAERMEPNEAILISGTERFGDYSGYSQSFRCTGAHAEDDTPRDARGDLQTHAVAMDALPWAHDAQYSADNLLRELTKAFAGFSIDVHLPASPSAHTASVDPASSSPIATGNWGCGVFGGDPELKSMIQWVVASQLSRSMEYFTFGDCGSNELAQTADFLRGRGVSVGRLVSLLLGFFEERERHTDDESRDELTVFSYIVHHLE